MNDASFDADGVRDLKSIRRCPANTQRYSDAHKVAYVVLVVEFGVECSSLAAAFVQLPCCSWSHSDGSSLKKIQKVWRKRDAVHLRTNVAEVSVLFAAQNVQQVAEVVEIAVFALRRANMVAEVLDHLAAA